MSPLRNATHRAVLAPALLPEAGASADGGVNHHGGYKVPGVGYRNAIDAFRFFCVLAVVPLHCVFLDRYPDAVRASAEAVERWAGALAWPGLKLLFLLSGFLFFRDVRSATSFGTFWKEKLRRRMRSLLVPYLFWNLFAVIDMPIPLRHTRTPKSAAPDATALATGIA